MISYEFTDLARAAKGTTEQATRTLEQTRLTLKAAEAFLVSKTPSYERSDEHRS